MEQKSTTRWGEKFEDLAESEKTQDNRLKNLELKLKILEKDNNGDNKFGQKEQEELEAACSAAIKNAEGNVYLLRHASQFPNVNNTGVLKILEVT